MSARWMPPVNVPSVRTTGRGNLTNRREHRAPKKLTNPPLSGICDNQNRPHMLTSGVLKLRSVRVNRWRVFYRDSIAERRYVR